MAKQAAEHKLSCFPIYQYYKIKSKKGHSAGKTKTITLVFKNKNPCNPDVETHNIYFVLPKIFQICPYTKH